MLTERQKCEHIKERIQKLTKISEIGIKRGKRKITDLKKIYCKLCSDFTDASLTLIAEVLSDTYDHASVLYSIKEFDRLKETGQLEDMNIYDEVRRMLLIEMKANYPEDKKQEINLIKGQIMTLIADLLVKTNDIVICKEEEIRQLKNQVEKLNS